MIDEHPPHPDLMTSQQATAYLLLTNTSPTAAAASGLLDRLVQRGELAGVEWGKRRIYHRAQLDALIDRTLEDAEADRVERRQKYTNRPPSDSSVF